MSKIYPLLAIWLTLCGCDRDPAITVQAAVATVVTPAVVAAREVVAPIVPPPPEPVPDLVHSAAVDLIVRFEVVSLAYYAQRLQGVICPPGASGPTWGIGYDGGHQTRDRIASDWVTHPSVSLLEQASGITGQAECRPVVAGPLRGVQTPLPLAQPVFRDSTLPRYHGMAARAFRNGWGRLPPHAQGALVSLVYNRGSQMAGDRRQEMRTIRDICVPASDTACIASQLRAMTRIWAGTDIAAGMARRRNAEADLAQAGT